jgi:hypothetical protein
MIHEICCSVHTVIRDVWIYVGVQFLIKIIQEIRTWAKSATAVRCPARRGIDTHTGEHSERPSRRRPFSEATTRRWHWLVFWEPSDAWGARTRQSTVWTAATGGWSRRVRVCVWIFEIDNLETGRLQRCEQHVVDRVHPCVRLSTR